MPATVKPGPSSTDDNVESPRTSTASNLSDVKSTSTTKHNVESEDESVNGDEFGSTDEVKVFKDEDEPDCSESYQAELLAEKSSLINESEQSMKNHPFAFGDKELHQLGTAAAAAAFAAGPGKYFDPSFGMGYLMSPYTAAYANGFGGPHMGRPGSPLPSFFYGDPLSSPPPPPPPAHMGTFLDKAPPGLRSPLYPLSQSQYPYSMIGPDQLAAWHQASTMYQSGSQRPGSPYSLTMSAASGARFSSFGLLGSSGHHLPHGKRDFDGRPGKDSSPMKKKEPHIKKPLNAFMLYMKEMRPVVQAECTLKESAAINQILGRRWHGLSRDEQAKYYEQARLERQKHMQMYPHWNARDNYRYGAKKKKRKRDKSSSSGQPGQGVGGGPIPSLEQQTNGPNSKKCRALYGVDQHNLWCKPCRRKKKCIRILHSSSASGNRVKGRQLNNNSSNNNNTGNSNNNEAVSDDDESQDSGDESSPRSGQTQTDSLDTTSEPSLTSPLGHNLHSLGSPASPHLGGSSVAPMASLDDWGNYYRSASYHRSSFPVFPLLTSASPSPKPPVGNDPRDSKNPLSVWQLTGRSQSRTPLESQHRVNEGDVNGICGAQVNGVRRFL